jgi:hypothetical protein
MSGIQFSEEDPSEAVWVACFHVNVPDYFFCWQSASFLSKILNLALGFITQQKVGIIYLNP